MTCVAALVTVAITAALVLGHATARRRPPRDTCPICRQADCTKEIL